jgi:prophage regulatory protein
MKFRNQAMKYDISVPKFGFLRLRHIIGDSKSDPPIPAIIPVCASTWWNKVKSGEYPQPVKLSENITAWRVEDILALVGQFNSQGSTWPDGEPEPVFMRGE